MKYPTPLTQTHRPPHNNGEHTSKSHSAILPKTTCLPNFSSVTRGLEIPNAILAKYRASSRAVVAFSTALNFAGLIRPFRFWAVLPGWYGSAVPVVQKLQCPQPLEGREGARSSPKWEARARVRQLGEVRKVMTRWMWSIFDASVERKWV